MRRHLEGVVKPADPRARLSEHARTQAVGTPLPPLSPLKSLPKFLGEQPEHIRPLSMGETL
jgi:hypothetical protein